MVGSKAAGSVCEPKVEQATQEPLVMKTRSFSVSWMVLSVPSWARAMMAVATFWGFSPWAPGSMWRVSKSTLTTSVSKWNWAPWAVSQFTSGRIIDSYWL